MAKERVGIEVDLGIQRHQCARLGDDQRIDLHQAQVLLDVEPVQGARQSLELANLGPAET